MNKKMLALVLSGVVVLSGCGDSKDPEKVEVQENDTVVENQDVVEEAGDTEEVVENNIEMGFEDALATNDISIVKMYIENNYGEADQLFVDTMIVGYDEMLQKERNNISTKYGNGKYIDAVMNARDENYKFDINLVEDESMKEEIKNVLDSGFVYESEEGMFYLNVDRSKFYATFKDMMSDDLRLFYDVMDREFNSPTFIEESVNIEMTFEEIKDRAVQLEMFIKSGKIYYDMDKVNRMMMGYIDVLTRVDQIDGGWNMETGQVNSELVKVYTELKDSDNKILSKLASDMNGILEPVEYKFDNSNKEIKDAIFNLRSSYFADEKMLLDMYK